MGGGAIGKDFSKIIGIVKTKTVINIEQKQYFPHFHIFPTFLPLGRKGLPINLFTNQMLKPTLLPVPSRVCIM